MQHQVVWLKRAVCLLLLGVLLAPSAAADHVFSHQLLVTGRVIGSDGVAVAGAPVELVFEGVQTGGLCQIGRWETETTPRGDFRVCHHAHAMPENDVFVTVLVLGESFRVPFDKVLRKTDVPIVLEQPTPREHQDRAGQLLLERTVLVTGRVFKLGDATVEHVPVNATVMGGVELHVRIESAEGASLAERETSSDIDGDFTVDFELQALPDGARAVIETPFGAFEQTLDARLRRADIDPVLEVPAFDPHLGRPGTGTPNPVPGPGVALAFVALAGALVLRRRG